MKVEINSPAVCDSEKVKRECNCRQRKQSLAPSTIHENDEVQWNNDKFVNEKPKVVPEYSEHNSCDAQHQKKSCEMPDSSDVIGNVLGPFGKFQLRTILLIFLVKIPSSWFMACKSLSVSHNESISN